MPKRPVVSISFNTKITTEQGRKLLRCPDFWEKMSAAKKTKVTPYEDNPNRIHIDIKDDIPVDLLGIIKVPIHGKQDLEVNEETDENIVRFKVIPGGMVNECTGSLVFKPTSTGTKAALQIDTLDLLGGSLDVLGLGKAAVVSQVKKNLRKTVANITKAERTGKFNEIIESCT